MKKGSDRIWSARFAQFALLLLVFSASTIFFFSLTPHLQEAWKLHAVLQDLTSELTSIKGQINATNKQLVRFTNAVNPWGRCLRIAYRKNCDDDEPLGSDVPPCGAAVLREMSNVLTEALEAAGISHWVSYGTLLGAARNHSILPWTGDIDIVVLGPQYKAMARQLKETGVLDREGYFFFFDQKDPDIGRVCITASATKFLKYDKGDIVESDLYYNAYPYVDIYQTHQDENSEVYSVKYGPPCRWPRSWIFPLTKLRLYDREVFAPGNYDKYLSYLYGPDWRDPPPPEKRSKQGAYKDACKREWKPQD